MPSHIVIIIAILLFRWLPQEEQEKEELNKLVTERTLALARSNEKLQREISDRREAQSRLKGYAENLNIIFNSTPNILVLVNEDGRVDMINHRGAALLGKEKEGVIGFPTPVRAWTRQPPTRYSTPIFQRNPRARAQDSGSRWCTAS